MGVMLVICKAMVSWSSDCGKLDMLLRPAVAA